MLILSVFDKNAANIKHIFTGYLFFYMFYNIHLLFYLAERLPRQVHRSSFYSY
jgi:hypothetical protein